MFEPVLKFLERFGDMMGRFLLTVVYFGYFLGLPFYSRFEKSRPVPERVTKHG